MQYTALHTRTSATRTLFGAALLLATLVCGTLLIGFPGEAHGQQDTSILESERAQLQQEVRELEEQIAKYKEQVGERKDEIATLEGQISNINTQIDRLDAEIRRTRGQISLTQLNIQETQEEIDNATATIQKNKATIAELLRSVYVMENETVVERLLMYSTLSEALSEVQYLDNIHQRLTNTLAETKQARANLKNHEASLVADKNVLEEKNRQLAIQKQAQRTQKLHKDTLLNQTEEEKEQFEKLLTQAEQEQAEFLRRMAQIEEQIKIQENFVTYFKAGEVPPPGTKLFVWPQDETTLTQRYGYTAFARRGAYGGNGHNGIDMSAGLATPIKSVADGTVVARGEQTCYDRGSASYIRSCNGYWGNWMAVKHPGGLVSLYSHMTQPSHKDVGEEVQAGEVIGYEGASGNVTGSHLHFSVYTEFFTYKDPTSGITRFSYNFEKTIDPLDYL